MGKIKTYRIQELRFLYWYDLIDFFTLREAKKFIKDCIKNDNFLNTRIIKLDYKTKGLFNCPKCGLNPNSTQSEKQIKWEIKYITKHGFCSACDNEKQ